MSRNWEKIFYIGCYLTQGSSYISAYAYGILHRLHHAYTDTINDPHSPSNSPNVFMLMWHTRNKYYDIYSGKTEVDSKFKKGLPRWDSFDKIAHNWISRMIWVSVYTLLYYYFVTAWWMYLLLPLHFVMGPIQGAVVNWWAHVFGYVNFKTNDTSKNILPVDLLFWGEAYHNNHHKFPSRPKNSVKWFEFDPGFLVMKILDRLSIIRLN